MDRFTDHVGSHPRTAPHILEIRSSIITAFTTLGVPTPAFACNIISGNVIHAIDLQEFRYAVR